MEHTSTLDMMIGNACIHQLDIKADIESDADGDWYVTAVYADALEIGGKLAVGSRAWVLVPMTDRLHNEIFMHFLTECRSDIDERWERHSWRYTRELPPFSNSAGRTL